MFFVHGLGPVGGLFALSHTVAIVEIPQSPLFETGGHLFPGLLWVVGQLATSAAPSHHLRA